MNEHILDDRLHDFVDGLLPDDQAEAVRRHLDTCGECRDAHAALASLVDELGDLPDEAELPRDLWGGIHARIDGRDADVLEFPGATRSGPRRVSMSWIQLVAAGLVLTVVSGGTVWMATGSGATRDLAPVPTISGSDVVQTASTRYDQAILDLETLVEAGKDVLAPETLRALEESLDAIEAAIEDARSALAEDPGSELANRLLANHQQAKLRVLQRAVEAIRI